MSVWDFSLTPANNTNADSLAQFVEGQTAASLNDNIRNLMTRLRQFGDDTGGAITTSGSGNNYTVTTGGGLTTLRAGVVIMIRANRTNTASATVQVDNGSTLTWRNNMNSAYASGQIVSGAAYLLAYDAVNSGWRTVAGDPSALSLKAWRNRCLNGGFSINQRAVSGTVVLAAGAYGHDRWKAGASGCTYTFATSSGVTTLTISAGTLLQVHEGAEAIDDTVFTASWSGTSTGRVYQGAASGSYAGGNGASITKTGLTIGTDTTLEISTGTISTVQFEPGDVPTAYEKRPPSVELDLCFRYFEVFTTPLIQAQTTGVWTPSVWFKRRKRASPTLATISGPTYSNASGGSFINPSIDGCGAQFNPSAAGGYVSAWTGSASSEL